MRDIFNALMAILALLNLRFVDLVPRCACFLCSGYGFRTGLMFGDIYGREGAPGLGRG